MSTVVVNNIPVPLKRPEQLRLNLVEMPLDGTIDTFTAGRIAKVSEDTIRRWCEQRRITATKPVGRWRVNRESLYALIRAGSNHAQEVEPKTAKTE